MKQTNIEIATELKKRAFAKEDPLWDGQRIMENYPDMRWFESALLQIGQKSLLASIMSSRTSLATVMDGTVLLSVKAWSAFS